MIFSDGRRRSIESIVSVFGEFARMSGLNISMEKSTIYLVGLSERHRREITSLFPFEEGTLPIKYLGLPLMSKRMTVADYSPLIEKIRCRIQTWKTRFLSFAGRLQLINSVLTSIINFWLTAFRLPNSCITELERLCSVFLWSGPELNGHKVKIAWPHLCKLKEEGGLGLRRLKEVNITLCLKLIWRILSANSLWVDWLKEALIQKSSFWLARDSGSGSWIWRKLIKYRDKASVFHRVAVGNGYQTSFWFDNWSSLGRLWNLIGAGGVIDMGIPKDACISDIPQSRRRRTHRVSLFNQIEEELYQAKVPSLTHDKHLWRNKRGDYRSKFSTRDTWLQLRTQYPRVSWYNMVWFQYSTPKFAFITWIAIQNRLSTGDRMKRWSCNAQTRCVLCLSEEESVAHLFFGCVYSTEVWGNLAKGLMQNSFSSNWDVLLDRLSATSSDRISKFLLCYVFQSVIYFLWRERNRRRHGEASIPPNQLIAVVDLMVRNRITSIRRVENKMEQAMVRWYEARSSPTQ